MSTNGNRRFSFRGFVALADILFALSASLLLLNPLTVSNKGDTKGLLEEQPLGNVTQVPVLLVKNRIVPINAENFAPRTEGQKTVWVRASDGEAVADAINRGGLLDKIMMNSDPKKNYLLLFVCSDSIAAFRSVFEVVTNRRWTFQWKTAIDGPFIFMTGQSGPPIGYPGENG